MIYDWSPLIELGPLRLHVFGLFVGIGAVLAAEILRRGLLRSGVPAPTCGLLAAVAIVSGLIGARLNTLLDHPPEHWTFSTVVKGTGLTWYGGFAVGALCVMAAARARGVSRSLLFDRLAPATAVGLACGRIGCFASADGDYGTPTGWFTRVAFADGQVPSTVGSVNEHFGTNYAGAADKLLYVHPAPVYELIPLILLAGILLKYRARLDTRPWLAFSIWAVVSGVVRGAVEFIRFNEPVALGLTTAQIWSVALIVLGAVLAARALRQPVPA